MKVFVLGGGDILSRTRGANAPGVPLVSYLAGLNEVSEVIVGDIDAGKARELYAESKLKGNNKVSFQEVYFDHDTIDLQGLNNSIKDCGLLVNSLTSYNIAIPIAETCVKAGVSCIDICDARTVARDILALDRQAREAGVLLLTGLGGGQTASMIAKHISTKFQVKKVTLSFFTAWLNLTDAIGTPAETIVMACMDDSFHALSGDIQQFVGGKIVNFRAGDGEEVYEYPQPLGKQKIYYYGHPEPYTLAPYIPGVENVETKAGFLPEWVIPLYVDLHDLGLLSQEPLKVDGHDVKPREVLIDAMRTSGFKRDCPYFPGFGGVAIEGIKDGKEVSYRCNWPLESLTSPGDIDASELSIAADLFCRGEIKVRGSFGPAGCIDPMKWFQECNKWWPTVYHETWNDKVNTTEKLLDF